ncbi:kelch repeat-containing protein [Nocardia sp. NPDC050175]|uniref:Kelch repeat-containing protein n=1 Tax=Nocardia sp. NPDC050175 TaxID=3364317 RepID=UPI00379D98AA
MTSLSTTEFDATAAVDGAGGTWTSVKDAPVAVNWQGADDNAVLLADGRVLVAGGQEVGFRSSPASAVFDPGPGSWTATGPLRTGRSGHTLTLLPDGTVLATGGLPTPEVSPAGLATAERFDPKTRTWGPASPNPMSAERAAHTATLLADGRVLLAGGYATRANVESTTDSAEIYDPIAKTWTPTAPMNEARSVHTAVLLHDGRVLVIGGTVSVGRGHYTALAFCEVFDPVTGTWTPTGSMARPRFDNTATVLTDGTVLVTGGGWRGWIADWVFNAHNDWTTERYNPTSGTWSRDADLSCARLYHRAVLLRDGRVLVLGGVDASNMSTGFRSTALYDPLTRQWSPAAGLATGRWAFGALALADGRVLVTGGVEHLDWSATDWRLTVSTEIYTPPKGEQ